MSAVTFAHPHARESLFRATSNTFLSGEMVSIMGPSGSGKSTFLDLVAGHQAPGSGTVRIVDDDTVPDGRAPLVDDVAWIFQSTPVFARRTAVDNVAISSLVRGASSAEAEASAREALNIVGLGPRAGAVVGELSGGEVQRVTIARALVSDAPLVLADEPSGQLDPGLAAQIAGALRQVARSGKIVIVATHDPNVDVQCDRRYAIRDGRVVPHEAMSGAS